MKPSDIEAALKLATPSQLASALSSRPKKKGVSRNRALDRCPCGTYSRITAAIRKHKCKCAYPLCENAYEFECENCGSRCCSDHGRGAFQRGGDGYGGRCCGVEDIPPMCWKCGGFDVDSQLGTAPATA